MDIIKFNYDKAKSFADLGAAVGMFGGGFVAAFAFSYAVFSFSNEEFFKYFPYLFGLFALGFYLPAGLIQIAIVLKGGGNRPA